MRFLVLTVWKLGRLLLGCLSFDVAAFSSTVRGNRPGKNVQLSEGEIRGLCLKSREIFLSQPILLELEAPLKICGKFRRVWLSFGA